MQVCRACVARKVAAGRVDRPRLGAEWDDDFGFATNSGVKQAGGTPPPQPKSRLSLFRFPALPKPPLPSSVDAYDFWPTINDIACPVAGCTQCVGQQDIGKATSSFSCFFREVELSPFRYCLCQCIFIPCTQMRSTRRDLYFLLKETWVEDCATDFDNSTIELQDYVRFVKVCM